MSNQSYAYAMGRIRAVERKMIGKAQLDRMIDAKSADDAVRILREFGYGRAGGAADAAAAYGDGGSGGSGSIGSGSIGSIGGGSGYERLLEEENDKLTGFMAEISPEPLLLDVFLRKYDYHNIKVLLKSEFSGRGGDAPLSAAGIVPPRKLADIVRDRSLSELPRAMAAGIAGAVAAYQKALDPQAIDIALDRAAYSQMLEEARELGSPFLTGLVEIYVDLANIGAFARIRAMNKSLDFLRGALLDGGAVDKGVFARHFADSTDNFIAALQFTPYGPMCEAGLKAWQAGGSLTAFERLADDFVMEYARAAKLKPFGPDLLVAHLVARQAELKNVRIVLVGKTNGIPGDTIRERLRETYA
ncbi:MAG: V-type ATPase subunit [Clostridiales bacterium]|nr:V-type ATPase subunit [Clostridiales bacterium]